MKIFESPGGECGEVACIVSLNLGGVRIEEELSRKTCSKAAVHLAGQALHNRGKLAAAGSFNR